MRIVVYSAQGVLRSRRAFPRASCFRLYRILPVYRIQYLEASISTYLLVAGIQGQIGYVPRDLTHLFDHAYSPGNIEWIWKPNHVPEAILGCNVAGVPAMRAAHIQVTTLVLGDCSFRFARPNQCRQAL
jgi:hypothetical protein